MTLQSIGLSLIKPLKSKKHGGKIGCLSGSSLAARLVPIPYLFLRICKSRREAQQPIAHLLCATCFGQELISSSLVWALRILMAHETRREARSLGLTPVTTQVYSPQSNGMAESFVNTLSTACMPAAFEHFNEVHPNSSLKMKSSKQFRQHHAAKQHADDHKKSALYAYKPCLGIQGQDHSD